jgi:hypothetical protein
MTESEWLAATAPHAMLAFLREGGQFSQRKARLFAVASCRRLWPSLRDRRSRQAVEVAERAADGLAGDDELTAAHEAAWAAATRTLAPRPLSGLIGWIMGRPSEAAQRRAFVTALAPCDLVSFCRGLGGGPADVACISIDMARLPANEESCTQAALLRCVIGNPFRPLSPRPFPAGVVGLAHAVYGGEHGLYALLADALEDLGQEEEAAHCREPLHAKGCHVVDQLLGKG